MAVIAIAAGGCQAPPRNYEAIRHYYNYEFTAAREVLREDALLRNDEQVVLDNARLGMASLADGDLVEAEMAFDRVFDLLSTAGLNADRTTAAVLVREDVRIWKGEPFEQALMYYYVAALYAVKGDWENARAATANSLFRLRDFGEDQNRREMVRRAAADDEYLDEGYQPVETDFALGYLMQGIASQLANVGGSDRLYEEAVRLNAQLQPIVDRVSSGEFNTILLIDYGKGPTKIAYGPDNALVRFQPQDRPAGSVIIESAGQIIGEFHPAADVNDMAQDLRWNNLENIRQAKAALGDALFFGGLVVASHGSSRESGRTFLAGLGMAAAGLLSKAGAEADVRYLEFAPRSIYVAAVDAMPEADLFVRLSSDQGAAVLLPDFEPGTPKSPRVVYLRLHGRDSPDPKWLTASVPIYTSDATGVAPGGLPWILGGYDVSTPTRDSLQAYQQGGHLSDLTVNDLIDFYNAEGIVIGTGAAGAQPPPDETLRHILEGGRALFTPEPASMGYKRIMFTRHPPYRPRSERVRNTAAEIGVDE